MMFVARQQTGLVDNVKASQVKKELQSGKEDLKQRMGMV